LSGPEAAVTLPELTSDELLRCVQMCAALRLPPQMGSYFREYLARRLQDEAPALAEKVRRCSEDELAALYQHVRRRQAEYLD
jgi:hypothetical protein